MSDQALATVMIFLAAGCLLFAAVYGWWATITGRNDE